MVIEQVILQIEADSRSQFEATFVEGCHYITNATGCRSVELLRSTDNPGQYVLRVGWDSIADHMERFDGSAAHQEFSARLSPYIMAVLATDHFEADSILK